MAPNKEKIIMGMLRNKDQYWAVKHSADKFLLNSTTENRTGIKACQFMTKTLQATASGKNIRLIKLASDDNGKKCIKVMLKDGKTDCISIPDTEVKTITDSIINYWVNRKEE